MARIFETVASIRERMGKPTEEKPSASATTTWTWHEDQLDQLGAELAMALYGLRLGVQAAERRMATAARLISAYNKARGKE